MHVDGDIRQAAAAGAQFQKLIVTLQTLTGREPEEAFAFQVKFGDAEPVTDATVALIDKLKEAMNYNVQAFEVMSALRHGFEKNDSFVEHDMKRLPSKSGDIIILLPKPKPTRSDAGIDRPDHSQMFAVA